MSLQHPYYRSEEHKARFSFLMLQRSSEASTSSLNAMNAIKKGKTNMHVYPNVFGRLLAACADPPLVIMNDITAADDSTGANSGEKFDICDAGANIEIVLILLDILLDGSIASHGVQKDVEVAEGREGEEVTFFQSCSSLNRVLAGATENALNVPNAPIIPLDGLFATGPSPPFASNVAAIPVLLGAFPCLPQQQQVFILNTFVNLLVRDKTLANLSKCIQMQPPLMELLLDLFPRISSPVRVPVTTLLQVVGRRTVNVSLLKRMFRLLWAPSATNAIVDTDRKDIEELKGLTKDVMKDPLKDVALQRKGMMRQPAYALSLLEAVEGMIESTDGPRNYVFLQGNGSGLLLPAVSRFPTTRGFSFSTWFSMVDLHKAVFVNISPDGREFLGKSHDVRIPGSDDSSHNTYVSTNGNTNVSVESHLQAQERASGLIYRPVLLSLRQKNGGGVDVVIELVNRANAADRETSKNTSIETSVNSSAPDHQSQFSPRGGNESNKNNLNMRFEKERQLGVGLQLSVRIFEPRSSRTSGRDAAPPVVVSRPLQLTRDTSWHHVACSFVPAGFRTSACVLMCIGGVTTRHEVPAYAFDCSSPLPYPLVCASI